MFEAGLIWTVSRSVLWFITAGFVCCLLLGTVYLIWSVGKKKVIIEYHYFIRQLACSPHYANTHSARVFVSYLKTPLL